MLFVDLAGGNEGSIRLSLWPQGDNTGDVSQPEGRIFFILAADSPQAFASATARALQCWV